MRRMRARKIAFAMAILTAVCWAGDAVAGSVVLQLVRISALTSVNDTAGRWQHEGGNILSGGLKVGQYALTRRITNSGTTSPLNTAMTTITLFFATRSGTAPENVTLQGAHDFTANNFRGSVSAASNRYTWVQGGDAIYIPGATATSRLLTISWTGASNLTLP